MPLYEFRCYGCDDDTVIERRLRPDKIDDQFCEDCGAQLKLVPSVPAWFPTGKYGKGGQQ